MKKRYRGKIMLGENLRGMTILVIQTGTHAEEALLYKNKHIISQGLKNLFFCEKNKLEIKSQFCKFILGKNPNIVRVCGLLYIHH